ncbi:MAG TPA: hypothetical protein VGI20_05435 [Rhizomicrobium sp.]|jgi:DNA-binding CsgD family transcriptional regulator
MPQSCNAISEAGLSRQVLDHLQQGIAVLDTGGVVLLLNDFATDLVEAADAIATGPNHRLRFLDSAADRKLRSALIRLESGAAPDNDDEVLVLPRSGERQRPLVASFSALLSDTRASPPRLLVTFSDASHSLSQARMNRLAERFGLTPAEQRLTRYLASGGRLKGAAKAFGVSLHTVRNQLRAVFDKSGVQRQIDLTRLVLTGSAANYSGAARSHPWPKAEMSHVYQ